MKAIVFNHVDEPLQLTEVPEPHAKPGHVVIAVKACGICGSDLHAAQEPGLLAQGVILGHEFAGEVVKVHESDASEWKIGDRIIALPFQACGTCAECKQSRYDNCTSSVPVGFRPQIPGAYAEYVSSQTVMSIKIPDGLSYADAATVEPLAVGLSAYRNAGVPTGANVLIIGAGIIGLAIAAWSRFFGAAEVGIADLVPGRLARAKEAGATVVIDASDNDDAVIEFERLTGQKPTVIFECVGRPIVQKLVSIAPPRSHLVFVGANLSPEPISILAATVKRLRMSFSFAYEFQDFQFSLRMLANGRINAAPLITTKIKLEEVPALFETLKKPNDYGKVLIFPNN